MQLKLEFSAFKPTINTKFILIFHLHTLFDGKMKKNCSFKPKNFKLAFRVRNNSAPTVLTLGVCKILKSSSLMMTETYVRNKHEISICQI